MDAILFRLYENGVVGGVVSFNDGTWGEVAFYLVGNGVPANEGGSFSDFGTQVFDVYIKSRKNGEASPEGINGVYDLVLRIELKRDGGGEERIGVKGIDADGEIVVLATGDTVEVACAGNISVKCPEVEARDDLLEIPCRGLLGHGARRKCQRSQTVATAAQVTPVTQLDVPASCKVTLKRFGAE